MEGRHERRDPAYGWVVVAFAFLAFGATSGAINSIAVFLIPLSETFGWPRGATAFAHLAGNLAMGVLGIPLGWMAGRRSTRPFATLAVASCGSALLLLSMQTALWQLYLYYGLLGGLGFGALWSPLLANLGGWFAQRRGLAVGIATAGQMLGSGILPWLARWLISSIGWQGAYRVLGLGVLIGLLPAALLVRDAPRGSPPPAAADASVASGAAAHGWPPGLVLFVAWLCCATLLDRMAMGTVMVHLVALAQDNGMAPQEAASVLVGFFGASFLARILFGRISDALGGLGSWMVATCGIMLMAGWVPVVPSRAAYLALAIGLGLVNATPTLAIVTLSERTPTAIRGVAIAIGSLFGFGGMGIGGWLAGVLYDLTGSYRVAFATASLLALIALGLLAGLAVHLRRTAADPAPDPARGTA